jgi:hypothetical protein
MDREKVLKVHLGIFYDLTKRVWLCLSAYMILQKFEHMGVQGIPLQWLESAFLGRTQQVYKLLFWRCTRE